MLRYLFCMSIARGILHSSVWLLLLIFAPALYALEGFQLQGAITQGLVSTSDHNVYGDSEDDVSFEFTEVSLNVSQRLGSRVRIAVQGIYRHAGSTSDDFITDFALIDYQFLSSLDAIAGLRLGRIKNPLGLYNETRDIAFTRSGVFLPQSIYNDNFRDYFLSSDSGMLYTSIFTDSGEWGVELGGGKPRIDDSLNEVVIPASFDTIGILDRLNPDTEGKKVLLGRIKYEHDAGRWLIALSGMKLTFEDNFSGNITDFADFDLPPFLQQLNIPYAVLGELEYSPWILSGQYNWDTWSLNVEYQRAKIDVDIELQLDLGPLGSLLGTSAIDLGEELLADDTLTENEAYYVQLSKQLTPQWSAYYRQDRFYFDIDDKSGRSLKGASLPHYVSFQHDNTIGTRWDINSSMLLMAEFHYIEGVALLSAKDNPDFRELEHYWTMLSISFSYRF